VRFFRSIPHVAAIPFHIMQAALSAQLRRRRRPLLWIAGLFAAYLLAGFLLAPVILRSQLVKRASATLGRPVAIRQVRVNPLAFSVTIRDLSITDRDGAELVGWDEFYANFQSSSLFRWMWYFDTVSFTHPRGRLLVAPDGKLNIADLIPPPAAPGAKPETPNPKPKTKNPEPSTRPPAIGLARFLVERGEFTFIDRSRSAPFETHFGPTSFVLRNFTTRPQRAGAYTFEAATEAGERFAWQGSLTFDPLGSAGRVAIVDLSLPKYAAFHRDLHQLDLLSGRLGVELDYELDLSGAAPTARLRNGRVAVADLKLASRGTTAPLATIPLVELSGLAADTAKLEASVATILIRGADLSATRRADGSIDWLSLLAPAVSPTVAQASVPANSGPAASVAQASLPAIPKPAGTEAGATPAAPSPITNHPAPAPCWSATLGSFEIAGATLHLHDLTNPRPVDLTIDQLGFKLTGASTHLDKPVALTTSLRWNGAGRIALDGSVTPHPLAADLQLDVADIALRPLDPYLAPFLDVLLTGGTARAKGHLTFALTADGSPDLHWQGDAGLAGFATVDGEFSEPLFGFADLALTNIRATTQPLAVSLDEIAVKEPFAHAIVFPDKRLNLTAILKTASPAVAQASLPAIPQPAGTETGATPAPVSSTQSTVSTSSIQPPAAATGSASVPKLETQNPKPSLLLTIARVTLSGARFVATDRSVTPAFTTELADFGGTISGLSSEQLARAEVDLTGRLGLAPLKVSGQINPLGGDAFTDVKVTFTGIELPPFTPYSGKFAGYTIDKGKLSLDLAYHLSARKLAAENKVVVDQFYLGQSVESPDAVKLPLKLALAILRDRDGRILIDLPIRGNLDDPDFKYGKAVMHTLGTLIVKAATAPFAMLGGLFGGGHDLSAVDFATGSAEFGEESLARLDGLIKALTERPGLSLEISSQPQRELDLAGLREAQLDALLRARKLRELAAKTTETIDPATLQLTPEETARYIAELHAERCPPATGPSVARASVPASPVSAPSVAQASVPAIPEPAGTAAGATPAPKLETRNSKPETHNLVVRTFRRLFVEPPPSERAAGKHPASSTKSTSSATAAGTGPAILTPEEIRAQVLATIVPGDSDFADLAAKRAQRIHEYLLTKGSIDAARVFLTPSGVPPATGTVSVPRVVFSLK
jgi:hypothetical protein